MPLDDDDMDPLDPDFNHFNNNVVNFTTHTIETFVKNSNLDPNSLNILHHNSRSLMSRGKQENYDVFFKSINNRPEQNLVMFFNRFTTFFLN